nr:glycosyltransferase family 2 protein [Sporolactobacillus spathodeae]
MEKELISVIVPIYKVEKYLSKCVDSILNQTYENLEIILINDGSPDNCGKMIDEYLVKDNRIKTIHKKNGGLSDARNAGLDVCQGKYVTCIDSDDYIEPDYIHYLYDLLKENDAALSICTHRYVTEDGAVINKVYDNSKVIIMNQEEALYQLCNSSLFSSSAWAKLYRKSDFANVRYPIGRIFEDLPTTYKLFMKADKIVFGQRALYDYVFRQGAISRQQFNPRRIDAIEFAEQMCNVVVCKYPRLKKVASKRLFEEYAYVLRNMVLSKSEDTKLIKSLYKKLVNVRHEAYKQGLTFKMKCYWGMSVLGIYSLKLGIRVEGSIHKIWMRTRK